MNVRLKTVPCASKICPVCDLDVYFNTESFISLNCKNYTNIMFGIVHFVGDIVTCIVFWKLDLFLSSGMQGKRIWLSWAL
jgi:hypothetical protein